MLIKQYDVTISLNNVNCCSDLTAAETWSSYRIVPPLLLLLLLGEEPLPPTKPSPVLLATCTTLVTCVSCSSSTPSAVFSPLECTSRTEVAGYRPRKRGSVSNGLTGFTQQSPSAVVSVGRGIIFGFEAMLWLSKWSEWEHTRNGLPQVLQIWGLKCGFQLRQLPQRGGGGRRVQLPDFQYSCGEFG